MSDSREELFEAWYEENGDHVEKVDYKAWCSYAFDGGYKAATEQQQSVIAELEGKFDILHDKLLAIGAQMLIAIPDDDEERRRAFSLWDDALKLAKVKGVKSE